MAYKKYNAILFGLGAIGSGRGIYENAWNNHLDSLKRAKWVKEVFIYDPYIDIEKFIDNKVLNFLDLRAPIKKPLIFIDAGPAHGREHRISRVNEIFDPELFLLEKPVNSKKLFQSGELSNKNLRINYFRRSLDTSIWLRQIIEKENIESIEVKISNGFFNAGTHLFDLLDFLKFKITKSDISLKDGNKFIKIDYIENLKKDVFEIVFNSKKNKIRYLNFGSTIHVNNKIYNNVDIKHRLKNIYQSPKNFNKLTDIQTDMKTYDMCNYLRELCQKKLI